MQPLNAVVKNGRLTLDAPTDLPEGQVVVLLPLDEILTFAEELNEATDDDEQGEDTGMRLVLAPRQWKRPPAVNAQSLIDELRAL
jgi:hypothetical protein